MDSGARGRAGVCPKAQKRKRKKILFKRRTEERKRLMDRVMIHSFPFFFYTQKNLKIYIYTSTNAYCVTHLFYASSSRCFLFGSGFGKAACFGSFTTRQAPKNVVITR